MQHMIDSKFDDIEIVKRFSKYAEIIHLWNVKIESNAVGHFPALPALKSEEGFAPIEDYFKIIREENPTVKIMFEHRSDLISDEELESCLLMDKKYVVEDMLKWKHYIFRKL